MLSITNGDHSSGNNAVPGKNAAPGGNTASGNNAAPGANSASGESSAPGENASFNGNAASGGTAATGANSVSGEGSAPGGNASSNGNAASGGVATEDLTVFNLRLNEIDRFANTIGVLGSGLLFKVTNEVEDTVLREQAHSLSTLADAQLNYEIATNLSTVNWLFLITVLMFYYTSSERLNQAYKVLDLSKEYNQERIRGREMTIAGDMLKITGYLLGAKGFELIADSTMREQQETPPP